HSLIDLTVSELKPADMVAIHDRQMAVYAGKSGICRFLKPETLQAFAEEVRLPGVFLQHLQTAFYDYQGDDAWDERDYNWFLGVFRRLFTSYRHKCPAAAAMLEKAAEEGRLEMDVGEKNPFFGTAFDNLFEFQSHYN